jgi:D-alanine-D-alanine ligase
MKNVAIFCAANLKTSTGSINTALNIVNNLDAGLYNISIITVDGVIDNKFKISKEDISKDPCFVPFTSLSSHPSVSKVKKLEDINLGYMASQFDAAIIAIYNAYGEDGRLIGLLETIGIPCLSPNLRTSALCMDKSLTKKVLQASGIKVPKGFEPDMEQMSLSDIDMLITKNIDYPVVVKGTYSGASRGTSIANNIVDLNTSINKALIFSEEVIIEEFISGNEYTVGVIGNCSNASALPIVMIKTGNVFFDFDAKYVTGQSEEICPAPISEKLAKSIQDVAILSYKAVKSHSHSRIDIIHSANALYVLEINTFPGLMVNSIFPKELVAANTSLKEFLNRGLENIIRSSLPNMNSCS